MLFEWDASKARINSRKHGLSFEEAVSVFRDPLALTFPDPYHSDKEEREITIGHTDRRAIVFVSHCPRGDRIRIISARRATKGERRQYEEGIEKEDRG
ncbi:MAG TPA: BrnT family toxin [Candidatus Hydrogenedentes bacterium]|nr:BrnT family toxin [Candidatus Hydrogenedentota bacterium]